MKLQYIEYLTNDALSESTRAQFTDDHTVTLFRAALNSHLRDGASELNAYVKAYRFLEESGFERREGKYVAKESPAVGDVHVDSPLGGGGKRPKPLPEGVVHLDDPGTEDVGDMLLDKLYAPPAEVQQAAASALAHAVADITAPLADGKGLNEAGVRKVAEWFLAVEVGSITPAAGTEKDAWGGAHAAKWADRVIRKIERDRPADVEKAGDGVMVAFWLDPEVAQKLAIPGGEKPEELHLTLAYLGKTVNAEKLPALEAAVKEFAASHGSLSGTIGSIARFPATVNSEGRDVAYAQFDAPGIQDFRAQLATAIEAAGVELKGAALEFGYTPHITLQYIDAGGPLPTRDSDEPIGVTFGKLVLSIGGDRKNFELTGPRDINDVLDADKRADVEICGTITKLDSERRMAFGWFSIVAIDGRPVEDTQQDIISPETIENAAYEFVLNERAGGEMHGRDSDNKPVVKGQLVESVVFSVEKQKAMLASLHAQGIEASLDLKCCAWWGGVRFDVDTWEKIKAGKLRAWSIGGKGRRQKLAA